MKNFLIILVLIFGVTCVYLWLQCSVKVEINNSEWQKQDSISQAKIDSLTTMLEDDSARQQIVNNYIAENKRLRRLTKQLRNEISYLELGDVLSIDDSVLTVQIPRIVSRLNNGIKSRHDTTGFNIPGVDQLRDSLERVSVVE